MSEGITILEAEVRNYRRITFAHAKLDKKKGIVRVTGKNRAGKTSLLNAIAAAIGGARFIAAENPIHDAATADEGSFVRLLLSNGFSIERKFTPAAPAGYLVVKSADGGKYNQTKLNEWLGAHTFDPLAFFQLDKKKRADLLLSLARTEGLAARLESLRAARKRAYEARTPFIVQERNAKSVALPDGERPELVDTSAEMQRLQVLRAEQAEREREQGHIDRLGQLVADQNDQIRELERRIRELAVARDRNAVLRDEAIERLGNLPDRRAAIEAVEAHIADAAKVQQELQPWLAYDRAQEQLAEARREQERLDAEIETIDAEVAELLQTSGIPVPNLSFNDEGEPLINGRPFEEASGAERIETAVAVALAAKPGLRICLLDEANDLDLDALAQLEQKAIEHDFQLWLVRIGLEGEGEVHLVDGKSTEAVNAAD